MTDRRPDGRTDRQTDKQTTVCVWHNKATGKAERHQMYMGHPDFVFLQSSRRLRVPQLRGTGETQSNSRKLMESIRQVGIYLMGQVVQRHVEKIVTVVLTKK